MTLKKQWYDDLPTTSNWQPRKDASQTLTGIFLKRCRGIEKKILLLSQLEREANVNNFDSGAGIEDIIREELRELCPGRYSIRAGVINDHKGRTAGDFEIIIANDTWFTPIKSGATKASRRFHFPIEAIYAVIEVKQTLTYKTLDEAMEKLVTCHRLDRPPVGRKRITENCKLGFLPVPDKTINTLYSGIIATDLAEGIGMEDIIYRFFEINKMLKPEERVRSLCILDRCTVGWGIPESDDPNTIRHLSHELDENLVPSAYKLEEVQCALYPFICELFSHLFNSVLGSESYYEKYGFERIPVIPVEDPDR